jgi:hypothetical protein
MLNLNGRRQVTICLWLVTAKLIMYRLLAAVESRSHGEFLYSWAARSRPNAGRGQQIHGGRSLAYVLEFTTDHRIVGGSPAQEGKYIDLRARQNQSYISLYSYLEHFCYLFSPLFRHQGSFHTKLHSRLERAAISAAGLSTTRNTLV